MLKLLVKCLSQKNRRLLQDCVCLFTGLSRSVSPSSSSILSKFLVLLQYSSPCQFPSSAALFSPGFWCQKQERKWRRRSKNSQVYNNQYKQYMHNCQARVRSPKVLSPSLNPSYLEMEDLLLPVSGRWPNLALPLAPLYAHI